jgi:hypothetical protein
MQRHIIVEGPDASGKDGLIRRLLPLFPQFKLHERASTSKGGPVPHLTGWVVEDMWKMPHRGPWVYNRHPLISEPIYAPIARGVTPQGLFYDDVWVTQQRASLAQQCVVVWCMPPASVVTHNVTETADTHMPGVADNIDALYGAYRALMSEWVGPWFLWDYTIGDVDMLVSYVASRLNVAPASTIRRT